MAWTETTRRDYDRRCLRYASESRDEEWALIEAFMLPVSKVGRGDKSVVSADVKMTRDVV